MIRGRIKLPISVPIIRVTVSIFAPFSIHYRTCSAYVTLYDLELLQRSYDCGM